LEIYRWNTAKKYENIVDNKSYKEYLQSVCSIYNTTEDEIYGLFLSAIAKAYRAVGAAYLHKDGTVTMAMESDDKLRVKDYIISSKQYTKIVSIFTKLLQEYCEKRDTRIFVNKVANSIIEVEIIKEVDKYYLVNPLVKKGFARGYEFRLKKEDCFSGEKLRVGNKIRVKCRGIKKDGFVNINRFDVNICKGIFEEMFHKLVSQIDEEYNYSSVKVKLDSKSKRVNIIVRWARKPSSFFKGYLVKELEAIFGKCSIF